jgi:PhnB protein
MKDINIYLTFDGNCREAMKFYAKCLGGELQLMPFSEEMCGGKVPEDAKDKIMHARLTKGSMILMASDNPPGMPVRQGDNFSINLNCESQQEIEKLFEAIGEKGKTIMALQKTFWAESFGMLTDQFGINWMFNFEKK